jgi:hypothetical protein|tara:strand:+ start:529 stop:726 length:198 start_codon:yes stop_codon:yes gene_type:complete
MAKKPFKSKTIWLGLLTSIVSVAAAKFPEASAFIDDHWNIVGAILGGIIIVLRGLTKRPLQLISE